MSQSVKYKSVDTGRKSWRERFGWSKPATKTGTWKLWDSPGTRKHKYAVRRFQKSYKKPIWNRLFGKKEEEEKYRFDENIENQGSAKLPYKLKPLIKYDPEQNQNLILDDGKEEGDITFGGKRRKKRRSTKKLKRGFRIKGK